MIKWRFPSNDYGENKGINDSGVAMFRGTPLKSLAREICQNSLDASTGDKTIVEFSLFSIPSSDIPGRDELIDAFNRCIDFWKNQKAQATKDFFNEAIKSISGENSWILRVSDFNTSGLTGSREPINTDWTNLTKSSGASDKKSTAGGSFGIGKYAPFACSCYSTVFYSTYDINEERASQGVSRIVTFTREDGQNTQGTGYFGNEKNMPIFEELKLDPNFSRGEGDYGTDIFIAGYKYSSEDWQKELIISVLDGFLGAIWNEKLELLIGDQLISKKNLKDIIDLYKEDLTGYTDKYYNVLTSDKTNWFEEDFFGLGDVKLGILLENQDSPNRISMTRQTGMKIMDKDRLPGHVPFMGMMFINGKALNEQLRAMENPEHTKWEPERAAYPLKAKQLVKAPNDYIRKKIEDLINSAGNESIDAIGVGNYIPDSDDISNNEETKNETVSDKVVEIEVKEVPKRSISGKEFDNDNIKQAKEEMVEPVPGGSETEWFHPGGKTETPGEKPGQDAHYENGDVKPAHRTVSIRADKVVCICIDKKEGKYMLRLLPDKNGKDGEIEVYLSAETQRYEAPIKSVTLIGDKDSIGFEGHRIKGVTFEKNKELRFSLELDYYDYCSMEVKMYATEE